jgi:ADP-heptose:LPS heptosyltransferase
MVRILLRFPHGLGDAVQFGVVLKHLARHRPDWVLDVRCGRGKHSALRGLCRAVFHDQEPEPPHANYETVADIGWYENYSRFPDRPNSKITNCLAEVFGLGWDADLGRYEVRLSASCRQKVKDYLRSIGCQEVAAEKFNAVVLHYEGNTSTWKKNLKHWQAGLIVDAILRSGRVPVVLDWDGRSPLPDGKRVFRPHVGPGDLWGSFGSGDAEVIAALVHASEAYVGIDSGPGKCASSTGTPTLLCWMEHHPIQFHDPHPGTTHLVPRNWRAVPPCDESSEGLRVASWFEANYHYRAYGGDGGLVERACEWLADVLRWPDPPPPAGRSYAVPNGIGDTLWVLHKIRHVAAGRPIDLVLCGDPAREVDRRSLPFLDRFPFVRSSRVLDLPILDAGQDDDDRKNDGRGRWRYLPDGERNGAHYLVPNAVLEQGRRLEEWLPEFPVDWDVVKEFDWRGTERGDDIGRALGPYACFYLGPEAGNVDEGHNRGFLWEPRDWIALGKAVVDRGLKIVLVGASYDRSYWETYCKRGVEEAGMVWLDMLGRLEIGETMALIRRARFFVSYQCGLGIFAHYLGQKVAMWWRPDGNSIHPKRLVAFDEAMAHSWTNPKIVATGAYLPLVYTRQTVADIVAEIDARGWCK